VTPGDLVALAGDLYRIDRVEDAGHRTITGVRVEPAVYAAPVREAHAEGRPRIEAPGPVEVVIIDLPLAAGREDAASPHVAVTATPWTGPVAVYSATADLGYAFDSALRRPAAIGSLLDPLPAAAPGVWMPADVRVRVTGSLQSRSALDVLNGANAAALRHGGSGDWEVIQFRDADLIAPQKYRLRGLLRGQAGTDGVMPAVWPAGTDFVRLDGAVQPLARGSAARGLERHYRVGPATRGYDDASYVHRVETFEGVAFRPYRPVHLAASRRDDGAIELGWIRRTRLDGDGWAGREVPLGEEREAYVVRVLGGTTPREVETAVPAWVYGVAEQAADGAGGTLVFEVAQISGRFGPGPFERIVFDG
jgi:hypothetical protein